MRFKLCVLSFSTLLLRTAGLKLVAQWKDASRSSYELQSSIQSSVLPEGATDLTDHKLWVTFTGFNAENMNCGITLKPKFEVEFSRGVLAAKPGFWRIIGYDQGKEYVEATQPVTAEYMFFFDITEPSILWRGSIDKVNMKVTDGVVITQKKRLGIFPYTETLATFTADILSPKENLPDVRVPKFSDQVLLPPANFIDPNDMKQFPEIFDPDFVKWWFANEDAVAKGLPPLSRPKAFWVPDPNAKVVDQEGTVSSDSEDLGGKLRQRRGPTGKVDSFKK